MVLGGAPATLAMRENTVTLARMVTSTPPSAVQVCIRHTSGCGSEVVSFSSFLFLLVFFSPFCLCC